MTWTETHRRWQALAEIEALVNASDSDELPWNAEYAAIFGEPDALVAALHHRWEQTRVAQLDLHNPEHVLEEQFFRLQARNVGVLRVLAAYRRVPRVAAVLPPTGPASAPVPA